MALRDGPRDRSLLEACPPLIVSGETHLDLLGCVDYLLRPPVVECALCDDAEILASH